MKELAEKTIKEIKSNKIIMDFVTAEALEKTASDIREKENSGTTAKAIELLRITNKEINKRVEEYINAGIYGVVLAKIGM